MLSGAASNLTDACVSKEMSSEITPAGPAPMISVGANWAGGGGNVRLR